MIAPTRNTRLSHRPHLARSTMPAARPDTRHAIDVRARYRGGCDRWQKRKVHHQGGGGANGSFSSLRHCRGRCGRSWPVDAFRPICTLRPIVGQPSDHPLKRPGRYVGTGADSLETTTASEQPVGQCPFGDTGNGRKGREDVNELFAECHHGTHDRFLFRFVNGIIS